jgi:D-serine deaminase-like pyridoxal phosphate-dependent protein
MERPIFQPVGTPVEELDTPALVVDLETMSRNIETLHAFFSHSTARLRPHVSCHQCPNIARAQLAAGGTVEGIAVATLGEAEVFSQAGFNDIFIANQVVTRAKIRRLCALARSGRIAVAVDNSSNLDVFSEVAGEVGATVHVLVEVEAGRGFSGASPGADALILARQASLLPNLTFQGLVARPGHSPDGNGGDSPEASRARLEPVLETRRLIEQDGLPVATLTIGETNDYEAVGSLPGVTEVLMGVYPLGDHNWCGHRPEFTPAARVLASIIGHPIGSRAVVDAGHKATGPDRGVPVLSGIPDATATRFSAEHGILELAGEAARGLKLNEKVWLTPADLALCVNQYDYFRAVRGGRLEGFWPIAARGRFD